MRISNVLKQDKVTISFEVFPPKKADGLEKVKIATEEIAANLHKRYGVTSPAASYLHRLDEGACGRNGAAPKWIWY